MFDSLKAAALGAVATVALTVAAPVANAATYDMVDGGSYTVTGPDTYAGVMDLSLAGPLGSMTGPARISADFTVLTSGSALAELALTSYAASLFTGLTASWVDTATNVLLSSTTLGAGNNVLSSTFGPGTLSQTLVLNWNSLRVPTTVAQSALNPNVTFDVAPIPLPATGLLLAGAVGATAMLRRRKEKATA